MTQQTAVQNQTHCWPSVSSRLLTRGGGELARPRIGVAALARTRRRAWYTLLVLGAFAWACSAPETPARAELSSVAEPSEPTAGGGNMAGGGAPQDSVQRDPAPVAPDELLIDEPNPPATAQLTTPGGEQLCDGLDNDGNGVVDDVDFGGDGICDCLRIATLGLPGTWGGGDVFGGWLDARSLAGAEPLGDAELTPELLAPYQLIVTQNISQVNAFTAAEVAALTSWVEAGGGLMTLCGYAGPDEVVNANALLAPFQIAYEPRQVLHGGGGVSVPVGDWEPHPIGEGVLLVGVDNGYPVTGAGTLVVSARDVVVGRALEYGAGHVFAWGDEWITYDSEWVNRTDYQLELFWVNAIKWLTPRRSCQVPVPVRLREPK